MSKKQLIREYKSKIELLKSKYKDAGVNSGEFEKILFECVEKLENAHFHSGFYVYLICLIKLSSVILLLYLLYTFVLESLFNILLCKIQEFLYPFLRLLRIIAIPVITTFPSLTELYDETCLLQNPYFYINGLDCWVCRNIEKVDIYDEIDYQINTKPPFLYKTNQEAITLNNLSDIYFVNKEILDKDAPKIVKNGNNFILARDYFLSHKDEKYKNAGFSYSWKMTRLGAVQIIRPIFPRPNIVPRFGLSTERFVMIEEPGLKEHIFPDTECNYAFIIQGSGVRLIELRPAAECAEECNPISVILEPPYLLWYNWWYWRPVTKQVLGTDVSISYVGSYC